MDIKIIESAILDQKEEFFISLNRDYCSRPEEKLVNLASSMAQVIIGIRRSGKSSLCFNIIKKSGLKFAYINFDDERLSNLKSDDLNFVLESLYKNELFKLLL